MVDRVSRQVANKNPSVTSADSLVALEGSKSVELGRTFYSLIGKK
jgi:hypothetical protein